MDRLEVAGVRIMDTAFTNTAKESPLEKPVAPAVTVTASRNFRSGVMTAPDDLLPHLFRKFSLFAHCPPHPTAWQQNRRQTNIIFFPGFPSYFPCLAKIFGQHTK